MPLYKKFEANNAEIGIWRIEEPLSFFQPLFASHPEIEHENKKLQWFATRHLVNLLAGKNMEIIKDDMGKPFMEGASQHISISHTSQFAAAMLCSSTPVGIDLETINPKVERIAHKFLRDDEIAAIPAAQTVEKLILYWCAKEALYKLYGKGGIEFKTQLLLKPFQLQQKGSIEAQIIATSISPEILKVEYEFFDGHVLSYVAGG
jgi:4'-phosphopantetheinyl transferase